VIIKYCVPNGTKISIFRIGFKPFSSQIHLHPEMRNALNLVPFYCVPRTHGRGVPSWNTLTSTAINPDKPISSAPNINGGLMTKVWSLPR
jgi:hypothetical protein